MSFANAAIHPTEGRVAVTFLDDEEEKPTAGAASPMPSDSSEPLLATVVAVGPKVTGIKTGAVVVMSSWARSNPRLGDVVICSACEVLATIG